MSLLRSHAPTLAYFYVCSPLAISENAVVRSMV